ncbi:MAG: hypothetical protein U9Q75_01970 [Pseudomonadota bacterium]|nr:hypothetical protein [Pseudomonadota bacterium]
MSRVASTRSYSGTSMLLYASLLVVMSLPAIIWHQQTGDISLYFTDAVPAGQLPYVLSKLAGMYALLFIALQIIVSLAGRLKLALIPHLRLLHPLLGAFVVLLALTHALLFFTAVSVRQGDPAWGLLFPGFRDFYHTHLSMGLFGLWILIAVMISGVVRYRSRSTFAKILHRGYWLSIVLVYLHALAIGTESQSLAGLALYSILGGVVLMMTTAWIIRRNRNIVVAS